MTTIPANDWDTGLDGLAWLRRNSDREIFKQALQIIAEDLTAIRQDLKFKKTEILVYLFFDGVERTTATLAYRCMRRRHPLTLVQHPLYLTFIDGRVIAVTR